MSGIRRSILLALALVAGTLGSCATSGATSIVRLHGTEAGSLVWTGSGAELLIDAGRGYSLRRVDPTTGATVTLGTFPKRYQHAKLLASSGLAAVLGEDNTCAESDGCKYMDYIRADNDLLALAPGLPLTCLGSDGSKCGSNFDLCGSGGSEIALQTDLRR
jgi:hypothetical protein